MIQDACVPSRAGELDTQRILRFGRASAEIVVVLPTVRIGGEVLHYAGSAGGQQIAVDGEVPKIAWPASAESVGSAGALTAMGVALVAGEGLADRGARCQVDPRQMPVPEQRREFRL